MQENSHHTHQILFQQLITGLKTRDDVVNYSRAITELSQQKTGTSDLQRCRDDAWAIWNREQLDINDRFIATLLGIEAQHAQCLAEALQFRPFRSVPPSVPGQSEECDETTRRLTEQAEAQWNAESAANDRAYDSRIAECERLYGPKPSKPWWRRLWDWIEAEPARNNI